MNRYLLRRVLLLCLASLLGALVPTSALAQRRLLRLEVWRLDKAGQKQPAEGASVSLSASGYGRRGPRAPLLRRS